MTSRGKETIFYDWHLSRGAHMVNFGGWEMPLNYGPGIVTEHLTTRKYCGLFDISHMGRFIISGEGALAFLQYTLTNNAAALDPGHSQYTIIPTETGGAVDDAYLYRLEEEKYLLVVNASNTDKDWAWLDAQRVKFPRAVLENHTEKIAMISLQGPRSKAVLEKIYKESHSLLPEPGEITFGKDP